MDGAVMGKAVPAFPHIPQTVLPMKPKDYVLLLYDLFANKCCHWLHLTMCAYIGY